MDINDILKDPVQYATESSMKLLQQISKKKGESYIFTGGVVLTKQNCYYMFINSTEHKEGLFFRLNTLPEKSMYACRVLQYDHTSFPTKQPLYFDINKGVVSMEPTKIKAIIDEGGSVESLRVFNRFVQSFECFCYGEFTLDENKKFKPLPHYMDELSGEILYPSGTVKGLYYKPYTANVQIVTNMDETLFGLNTDPNAEFPEAHYNRSTHAINVPIAASGKDPNDVVGGVTPFRPKADTIIDTSNITNDATKKRIEDIYRQNTPTNNPTSGSTPKPAAKPTPKKAVIKKQPKKERAKRNPRKFLTFHNVYTMETENRVDSIFSAFEDFLIDGKLPVNIAYTYLSRDNMEYPSKPRPQSFAITKDEFKAILNMDVTEIKNKFNYSSSAASTIRRNVKFIFNGYHDTPGRGARMDERYIEYIESQLKLNKMREEIIDGLEKTFKEDAGRVDFASIYNKSFGRDNRKAYKNKETIDDRILDFVDTALVSKFKKKDQLLSILISLKDKFPSIVDGAESFDNRNTILDIMALYCIYRTYDYRTTYNFIFNEKFKAQLDAYSKVKVPEIVDAFNISLSKKKGSRDPSVFKVSFLVIVKYLLWIKNLDAAQKRSVKNAFTNPDMQKGFNSLPMVMKAFICANSISLNTKKIVSEMLGIELEEFIKMRNYASKLDSSYRNVYASEALRQLS